MPGAFGKLADFKIQVPKFPSGQVLNSADRAGPRRLVILAIALVIVTGVVGVIAISGQRAPAVSQDARRPRIDPLPGGLHTTPEQDALAMRANDADARAALKKGVSFTPPMMPSQPVFPAPPRVEQPAPAPAERPASVAAVRPHPAVVPAPLQAAFPGPLPSATTAPPAQNPPQTRPIRVAQANDAADQAYRKQIDDLFSQWGGRPPRTDVILPPPSEQNGSEPREPAGQRSAPAAAPARDTASPAPAAARSDGGEVLIPAGRGVYAHPILALNSDASSPVVLQADSGPIAGDRMIGTFAKQDERLVIRVNTVVHNGENLGVDGVVVAPDTMEAAVASNVDQHYVSRFLLPAAAAFVAGLGQAIAQTSNTATVLSPFGGAAYATHLNINQQLGVAAGAAASQIGQTLAQSAPKGPTISLEANVAVGVMFLSNVTAHRRR
jgi:intracellular multiplication protein IcmE